MITWQHEDHAFTYRVAAVIVDQDRVLLHRAEKDPFWSLPGGRVEFLELAADALIREMREEIGAPVTIQRLLWVVENFFLAGGETHHEVGLYFFATLTTESGQPYHQESFRGLEDRGGSDALKLHFQWFPRDAATLNRLIILPAFLQQGLIALPDQVVHITNSRYPYDISGITGPET